MYNVLHTCMCSDPRPGGRAAPETGGHLHPADPHWHSALHAHHLQPVPGAHRHSPAGAASALGRVSMESSVSSAALLCLSLSHCTCYFGCLLTTTHIVSHKYTCTCVFILAEVDVIVKL